MKTDIQMAYAKSTKNTHLFTTDDPTAPAKSIYINKFAMVEPPGEITVTITAVDMGDDQ
jgi:hypothetical protein